MATGAIVGGAGERAVDACAWPMAMHAALRDDIDGREVSRRSQYVSIRSRLCLTGESRKELGRQKFDVAPENVVTFSF
jgi:hypothetical protein